MITAAHVPARPECKSVVCLEKERKEKNLLPLLWKVEEDTVFRERAVFCESVVLLIRFESGRFKLLPIKAVDRALPSNIYETLLKFKCTLYIGNFAKIKLRG